MSEVLRTSTTKVTASTAGDRKLERSASVSYDSTIFRFVLLWELRNKKAKKILPKLSVEWQEINSRHIEK